MATVSRSCDPSLRSFGPALYSQDTRGPAGLAWGPVSAWSPKMGGLHFWVVLVPLFTISHSPTPFTLKDFSLVVL